MQEANVMCQSFVSGINLSFELQDILVLYEHHDTEVHHFVLSEKRYMYQKKNMYVKAFYLVS